MQGTQLPMIPVTGKRKLPALMAVNILALIMLLYFGRPILVPLLYGFFIAIILYPLCRNLEGRGWRRWTAISFGLLLVTLLFAALVAIIFYQYNLFRRDLPALIVKIKPLLASLAWRLSDLLGIDLLNRQELFQNAIKFSGGSIGGIITSGLSGAMDLIFYIVIIPLYAALILNYRQRLMNFLVSMAGAENRGHVENVTVKTIKSYSSYIKGMLWVYLLVGILNSLGLLILNVKYAILFGMITAFMTIIPYFGIIISALLPISVAWLTTGTIYTPLGVIIVFSVVQYLEGNFIYPYVVGKRVNVNILVSLISVFAGGLLWGVSGMVLVLPMVAVIKIIADESEELRPLSILLGDKNK